MPALKDLGVVFIVVNWFIVCPFCVYYSLLYLKKVKESCHRSILQYRQPGTIKMNLFIICYFLLFEQTITLFQTFNLIPSIPSLVSLCITLPTYCLVFYSAIIRSWLLYYDQQIYCAVLQSQLQSISNNSYHNSHLKHPHQTVSKCSVWFSNHRSTLGSAKFLYSLLLLVYLTSIVLLLIFGYLVMDIMSEETLETHSDIDLKRTYIYLAIVQLSVIITPILLCFVLLSVYYLNRKSVKNKLKSQKRYAKEKQIPFDALQDLDKEIILILVWCIISCVFRVIVAILSNLIIMHLLQNGDIYSLWSHDTSVYTGIYVLYTVWAIVSVFILHLIQTRRPLYILSELDWFNSKHLHKSPTMRDASNSKSDEIHKFIDTAHADSINIIHVTGHNSDDDDDDNGIYMSTHSKTSSKKWKYENIATNGMDVDEEDIESSDDDDGMDMNNEDDIIYANGDKHINRIGKLKGYIFGKNKHNNNEMIEKAKTDHFDHEDERKSGFALLSNSNKAKSDNMYTDERNVKSKVKVNGTVDDDGLNNRQIEIGLEEILSIKEGYDLFMKHLGKEYSTENLCFLTEVAQFKHRFCLDLLHDVQRIYHGHVMKKKKKKDMIRMKKELQGENNDRGRRIHLYSYNIAYGWYLRVSDKVPLTEILTDDHWRSFYTKAHKLYKKYIEQGSDLEINISYQCRNCITKYFNNYSNTSLSIKSKTRSCSDRSRERDISSDICSVDSYASHHHSHDDLSRYKRRGSLPSVVDEGFRLKKSRSFHNVFEADQLYLEEDDEDNDNDNGNDGKERDEANNDHKCKIKLHSIRNTNNILDKLDENVFLLQMFDDAAEEIYSVLKRDSLHRFYTTQSYSKHFVSKYISSYRENKENKETNDTNIVFFYYCSCKQRKQCECADTYLKRESFKNKLKKLKRKGIKRKKPFIRKRNTNTNTKTENKCDNHLNNRLHSIKITRQNALDVNHWTALKIQSPVPAVSISRRSTKSISSTNSPVTVASTCPNRQKSFHSYAQTATTINWKIDTKTMAMDSADYSYYYDDHDLEYDSKGVPIVRIINVNVVSNAHHSIPPPPPPSLHRKNSKTSFDNTPSTARSRTYAK